MIDNCWEMNDKSAEMTDKDVKMTDIRQEMTDNFMQGKKELTELC
ncbi:hypothetical protein [Sporosarcina sp. SAFN-015]